ncbi:hypothetical protein SKDZ_13G2590 [Saccharomyces kudriavzevii ZP591]|nr:hypothetical protein SKDZ_13G2590 [Saccharomyces kudriavzevii ZP591]
MYEYCSVIIKKYSKYTVPSIAPKGFYSLLEPPQLDKWQHLSTNCTLQFQILLEDSGQVVIHVILNNSTLLEHIRLPLGNNHDLIQFSSKCPIISCKYISEEYGPKMLRRFQINLPSDLEFNRIVICLRNLNFIMRTAKTSIAQNTIKNQVLDNSNNKRAEVSEDNNLGTYSNFNTQFQTQNMIMDFSQCYQEESERELSNRPNRTLPRRNFSMVQQSFPNADVSVEQFSQDFNTPLASQAVPSRPEQLSVKLAEASQGLPNVTNCSSDAAREKKNTPISVDLPLGKDITSCNTNLSHLVNLPRENLQKEENIEGTGLATTPAMRRNIEGQNVTKQDASNRKKVDNKLSGSQETENANISQRNTEISSSGPNNRKEADSAVTQEVMMGVAKTYRNASRKISKRLIKEKLKDEGFMKWVNKVETVLSKMFEK